MWINPFWGSLKGPDAEILRAVFQSLQDWTRNPTFGNKTDPGPASDAPQALKVYNEYVESSQFESSGGSQGWRISANGTATFNSVTVKGTIVSGSTITGTDITGGTISGTNISGVTVTGSTFRTANSGNRVEVTSDGTFGYVRFYSGDGNEYSAARVYSAYSGNRTQMVMSSGTNASDHLARIIAASGPHTGGRGNLTFQGTNNAVTAVFDLDEHHYMETNGASRWYGAGQAERFAITNAGIYIAGKWNSAGPTQDVLSFTQASGLESTFVDWTPGDKGFKFWSGGYGYSLMDFRPTGNGQDWRVANLPSVSGTILRRHGTSAQIGPESSSAETKIGIQDLDFTANDNPIWKLKPKRFLWDPEKVANASDVNDRLSDMGGMAGLIAEDVAEVMPDAVHVDEEGKPVSLESLAIQAYLVDGVQHCHDGLKRRVVKERELEDRLAAIEAIPAIAAVLKGKK